MPLKLIDPVRHGDDRGWFTEVHSDRSFAEMGLDVRFVQDNHSFSRSPGTIRGLHFQTPPHAQAKLVRCIRGRIFDVAVDLRRGSPTYGRWMAAELSAENGRQMFIPVGFAHGFMTLEPDAEVTYKASDFYAPECDGGLFWRDADINIDWPASDGGPHVSPKDQRLPTLSGFESPFAYDGRAMGPAIS